MSKRKKVVVGAGNGAAIKFYERCGFSLALTRLHHGRPMNVYTLDLQGERNQSLANPHMGMPSQSRPTVVMNQSSSESGTGPPHRRQPS